MILLNSLYRFNGLEDRYDVRLGDLRTVELGDDELFDMITGTPPYFPMDGYEGSGPEHPQKQACRCESSFFSFSSFSPVLLAKFWRPEMPHTLKVC